MKRLDDWKKPRRTADRGAHRCVFTPLEKRQQRHFSKNSPAPSTSERSNGGAKRARWIEHKSCDRTVENIPNQTPAAGADSKVYISNTHRPPAMVLSTGMLMIDIGSSRIGSRPSTTRSASFPASI